MPVARLKVTSAWALTAPGGATLHATDVRAELHFDDAGTLGRALVTLTVSPADWARVDAGAWFGLDPAERGPTFGGSLDAAQPVLIEAQLRADPLAALAERGGDKWDVAADLASGEDQADLLHTECYEALNVKQERGGVFTGFATRASGLVH